MTPEEKKHIKEEFTEVYCSLSTEEQNAVITCTNAAIPTEDGSVIPSEYVMQLICHLHELWKLDISEDDFDPCYECRGYGDDYRIEDDELVSNCDGCPHDKRDKPAVPQSYKADGVECMICPKCKVRLEGFETYCYHCGIKLDWGNER